MDALDFPEHNFDIIWSEGAIYIMGSEAGLRQWKPMLNSIQTNKERILAQGYALLNTFVLPEVCWWQHFLSH